MSIKKPRKTSGRHNYITNKLYIDYAHTTRKTTNNNLYIPWHSPPHWGITRALCTFIQRGELSNCLEVLEKAGYTEERALLMLAAAQVVGGAA